MRRLLTVAVALAIALPLHATFSGTDVFVGAVGRGPGAASSDWYTSVWIHNPGTAPATVVAHLLLRNQTNPSPASQTITVQPGETRRIDNIVETLFGQTNAFGAMRFTSASRILVNARIYSKLLGTADSESSGQPFDGVPASFAIGSGQSAVVLGAHQTEPFASSLFRYNFGFVETAGGSGTMRAAASDASGAPLGTKDYSVGPYEARQFGIADVVPGVSSTNVRLTISIVDGTAKVIAFGSGIANRSNDPTTFDMSFRDDLLAGPAAATSVKHDATLSGDGSDAAPLGVAGAGSAAAGNVLTAAGGGATVWQAAPGFTLPFHGSGTPVGTPLLFLENNSTAAGIAAVLGRSAGAGNGLTGNTEGGIGVSGTAFGGTGVFAFADSGTALKARSESGLAMEVIGRTREAIRAHSDTLHGVWGEAFSNDGYGLVGNNTIGNHFALLGTLGYAGDFVGNVRVKGALSTFSGTYTIDDPLQPLSMTLSHAAVQSPDMKNIYDGVVTTDRDGFAAVELPEWFEALNGDFRYQLTVIGRFAQAIVDTEIAGNRFTIRTDRPNVKVSWQVTGIRHDPWANEHRIAVREEKPPDERGYYLAPEVYGQPRSKDAFWAKHPELIRK